MALTLAISAGLCSCTVEKPNLEETDGQTVSSEGTSANESGKKKLTVRGTKLTGKFSDRFKVEAEISGNDRTSAPTYTLRKINLTEDQIAEKLMSGIEYNRKDCDHGVVVYSNDNEKLAIDFNGVYSNSFSPSPGLTYALDKGKEYESVIKGQIAYDDNTDETKDAVSKVTDILDKLPIKYHDVFTVEKLNCDELNTSYSCNFSGDDQLGIPNGDLAEYVISDELSSDRILLDTEGKKAELDKDFRFKEDDECFLVSGYMKVSDIPLNDMCYEHKSIVAAVSSRGVEYLFIENLYIPDNGSSDSPIITPEQAVEIIYKDFYEVSPDKNNYKVEISSINLSFYRDNERSDDWKPDATKATIRPVWRIIVDVNKYESDYSEHEFIIYADNGDVYQAYSFGDPAGFYDTESSENEKE